MAFVNPYRAGAENFDHAQRVADDDDRLVGVAQFFELVEALVLEVLVADGQNFVDEQNFGVNIDGNGESQTHIHTGRVRADRFVDKVTEFGKFDDVIDTLVDFILVQNTAALK